MINLSSNPPPHHSMLKTFSSNRYRIALNALGSSLLFFLVIFFSTTPQWEARGTIRLGQAPVLVSTDALLEITPIMPVTVVMESMKQPSLLRDVTSSITADGKFSLDSPRIRLLPSGHIEVKARAPSRAQAIQYVNGIYKALAKEHDKIYEQRMSTVENEMHRVERQLMNLQVIHQNGLILLDKALKVTPSLSDLLLLNIVAQQTARIDWLSDRRVRLNDILSSKRNSRTDFVGGVDGAEDPVTPNKILCIVSSLFFGLLVASVSLLTFYRKEKLPKVGSQK